MTEKVIRLQSGGTVSLRAEFEIFDLTPADREFLFGLIDEINRRVGAYESVSVNEIVVQPVRDEAAVDAAVAKMMAPEPKLCAAVEHLKQSAEIIGLEAAVPKPAPKSGRIPLPVRKPEPVREHVSFSKMTDRDAVRNAVIERPCTLLEAMEKAHQLTGRAFDSHKVSTVLCQLRQAGEIRKRDEDGRWVLATPPEKAQAATA